MSETTTVTSPELTHEPETLDILAARKHAAFAAKVNAPIFGSRKNELMAAYNIAEEEYLSALRTEVGAEIDNSDIEDVPVEQLIDMFESRVNERLQLDREAQKAELIAQGGKKAEFLNWYTNLPRAKKIGVTAGLAAGGAAASLLASGLGIATAATAVTFGAYRLTRGYAMRVSTIYSDKVETPQFTADSDTDTTNIIESGLQFLRKDSHDSIERAERVKKRAIKGAVGAVALGSAAGWGIRETMSETGAIDYLSEKAAGWKEKLSGFSLLPQAYAEPIDAGAMSSQQTAEQPQIDDNLSGRNAHLYGRNEVIDPPTSVEHETELASIRETFEVEAGHGYTHELIQAVDATYGVKLTPEEAWALHQELVRTAGSDYIDLLDHSGKDTYSMGNSKYDVGIADAGEAQWSEKAVEVLDKNFSTEVSAIPDTDTSADTPTSEEPTAAPSHIDRNQLQGTGGVDFDSGLESDMQEPSGTAASESGTSGRDVEAPSPEGENTPETLTGLTAAQEAVENGTDGVNWTDMGMDARDMYGHLQVGDVNAINNNDTYQNTLDYIRQDVGDLTYPNTDIPIIEYTGSGFAGQWTVNAVPKDSYMHPKVLEVFKSYIDALPTNTP